MVSAGVPHNWQRMVYTRVQLAKDGSGLKTGSTASTERKSSMRPLFTISMTWISLFLLFLSTTAAENAIDIGSRRELFVDHYLIDQLDNLQMKLHEPRITPLVPGTPAGHYATVIKEGNLFRRYDRGGDAAFDGEDRETTRYWESKDGIHWTAPNLGLVEVDGSRDNNVIIANTKWIAHNFSPFLDQRPGVSQSHRFKALAGVHKGGGLHAFFSADGIHWKKFQDNHVIIHEPFAFDSQNVAFWSEIEQRYICYFRTWATSHGRLRTISRTTSMDFIHWSRPVATDPNLPGEHLYTSGTHPYFRAPHIYIALPTRFLPDRGSSTDVMFMTSRGGNRYQRTFLQAFIRPGLDPAKWGNRSNYAAWGVIPTGTDEMSLYVRERRYVLRTDGFSSVHASHEQGELLTKPIRFNGRQLEINYATSAAGQVQVEIQDPRGKPIPGYRLQECVTIVGDHISRTVSWKNGNDIRSLAGKPVRLRMVMTEADLYSMRFHEVGTH